MSIRVFVFLIITICMAYKIHASPLYNQHHQMIVDDKGKVVVDPKLAYDMLLKMGWSGEQAVYLLLEANPRGRVQYIKSSSGKYGPKVKKKTDLGTLKILPFEKLEQTLSIHGAVPSNWIAGISKNYSYYLPQKESLKSGNKTYWERKQIDEFFGKLKAILDSKQERFPANHNPFLK